MIDAQTIAQQILAIVPPVMRTVAAELRRSGHMGSPAYFGVLYSLAIRPCNFSELAELQGVSRPTISNTIASLEARGLVRRARSLEDRRVVMIELTLAGREHLVKISHQAETRVTALLENISASDRQTLVDGLAVLRKIFAVEETARLADPRSEPED